MLHHIDAPLVLVGNSFPREIMPLVSYVLHAACAGAGRLTPGTSPAYIGYWPACAAGTIATVAARAVMAISATQRFRTGRGRWDFLFFDIGTWPPGRIEVVGIRAPRTGLSSG